MKTTTKTASKKNSKRTMTKTAQDKWIESMILAAKIKYAK